MAVDLQVDVRSTVDAPSIVVYDPARAFFKTLALQLLGVTALNDATQTKAVLEAAASLNDADDQDWTAGDARKILSSVGTLPAPSHVLTWRLPGQGTLLFRAVLPEVPKVRRLNYPAGVARPSISVLAALRPEGIIIPKEMCMDVPVKLVEDEDGLALAAYFRRGKLRNLVEESAQEAPPSEQRDGDPVGEQ